jgi:cystathionine beta-synthase
MWLNNVLETIGNTPIIKLNKITKNWPGTILAKVDYFNPGNSIKDRMALKMVEVAEAEGKLKPGSTIIEGTSGNTGMGLALAACVKGYKCIFVTTEKQSKEKADILKKLPILNDFTETNLGNPLEQFQFHLRHHGIF